jgi:hypothetical protein
LFYEFPAYVGAMFGFFLCATIFSKKYTSLHFYPGLVVGLLHLMIKLVYWSSGAENQIGWKAFSLHFATSGSSFPEFRGLVAMLKNRVGTTATLGCEGLVPYSVLAGTC